MARCEDFPCCGHEQGCCPDFDDTGKQLNMRCTCGAVVPLHSRSSICTPCMQRMMADDGEMPGDDGFDGILDDFEGGADPDEWDDDDYDYPEDLGFFGGME